MNVNCKEGIELGTISETNHSANRSSTMKKQTIEKGFDPAFSLEKFCFVLKLKPGLKKD